MHLQTEIAMDLDESLHLQSVMEVPGPGIMIAAEHPKGRQSHGLRRILRREPAGTLANPSLRQRKRQDHVGEDGPGALSPAPSTGFATVLRPVRAVIASTSSPRAISLNSFSSRFASAQFADHAATS